jgi:hypothetical protein
MIDLWERSPALFGLGIAVLAVGLGLLAALLLTP